MALKEVNNVINPVFDQESDGACCLDAFSLLKVELKPFLRGIIGASEFHLLP